MGSLKVVLILFSVLLILPIINANNQDVIIKNYPIKHKYWEYDGLFIIPNIIIMNGYTDENGLFNYYNYKRVLAHEYRHYLCYKFTNNVFCNDKKWEKKHNDNKIRIWNKK